MLAQTNYDSLMRRSGLVDMGSLEPSIRVELKYSTSDNFVGQDMYGSLECAYLERGFASRIARAQRLLSKRRKGYRLLIYDAARPMSVQAAMYALVEGTPLRIYVAPAKRGGRHNYGVAVDLTIIDAKGKPLDMGSPFDHFGPEAHVGREDELVKAGRMSSEVRDNRRLLYSIMSEVGLRPYDKEWWHYQERIPMTEVRRRYKRLDF
ncbi:MAG: M15 family metallopeptidase [Porphyromonadaceae bacterium]|nr:M15 family metallopeptidase [Porphyromonadaceae bacterium]